MKTKLPCDECKGQCCNYPAMSNAELQDMQKANPLIFKFQKIQLSENKLVLVGQCPFLIKGKCSVWEVRPQVCKDYGEVPDLPCEYLYPKEALAKAEERLMKLMEEQWDRDILPEGYDSSN